MGIGFDWSNSSVQPNFTLKYSYSIDTKDDNPLKKALNKYRKIEQIMAENRKSLFLKLLKENIEEKYKSQN